MQGTMQAEAGEGPADLHFDRSMVGIVRTHDNAEEAVRELERSGFDMKKLSVIGKGYHSEEHPLGFYTASDRINRFPDCWMIEPSASADDRIWEPEPREKVRNRYV